MLAFLLNLNHFHFGQNRSSDYRDISKAFLYFWCIFLPLISDVICAIETAQIFNENIILYVSIIFVISYSILMFEAITDSEGEQYILKIFKDKKSRRLHVLKVLCEIFNGI